MKASVACLAFALSGTALGFPFKSISASASFSSTSIPRPSQTSVDVPLLKPFAASSTSLPFSSLIPSGTPVIGGQPVESSRVKRGDVPIPTGFSSLASEAESALGALASVAPQKRAGSPLPTSLASLASETESALGPLASLTPQKRDVAATLPTGLSSLASEAESALGTLASLAPQKRGGSSLPTGLSSLASEAESALSALEFRAPQKRSFTFRPLPPPTVTPSGVASGYPTTTHTRTPPGLSSSLPTPTSVPLVVPTGSASFGFPLF